MRAVALAALGLLGCGTKVTVAPAERGAEGESCEARVDCAQGLLCVDLVCRAAPAAQPGTDGGAGPLAQTMVRSGAGESCTRRADCESGLRCLSNTCRLDDVEVMVEGPRKGTRGESCVVSNDCEVGMGCFSMTCGERSLLIPTVEMECHRVECVEEDDCCKDFVAEDPVLCADLQTGCETGARADCNLFASLCECNLVCEDSACVASVSCTNDLDCGGSGVLRCFAGRCAQCGGDSDCTGQAACVGGFCRGGCERNEQCPLLSECRRHQCEHVGCRSDRDCLFVTGSPRSRCVERQCRTPCETDRACASAFDACVDGLCAFVGCEHDYECRAALGLFGLPAGGSQRAVCRAPVLEQSDEP